jgi:hypothetical protein
MASVKLQKYFLIMLQRNAGVKIWGRADKGEQVAVSLLLCLIIKIQKKLNA